MLQMLRRIIILAILTDARTRDKIASPRAIYIDTKVCILPRVVAIGIFTDVGQIRSDWNVKKLDFSIGILLLWSAFACKRERKKKPSNIVPRRGPGRIFRKEGEGGECIFKIVTMQFRWRIHNESLSRERARAGLPG